MNQRLAKINESFPFVGELRLTDMQTDLCHEDSSVFCILSFSFGRKEGFFIAMSNTFTDIGEMRLLPLHER
ncbi:hypothetical protein [Geobacillus sp. 47C-IIb]|jgi:hypothetical protein|uniref:hypothetical protein n=1 Tax=unclassified Geobacillus TaxID=2642459 RepID=UPI00167FFCC4|nr:hypothetical protein [Geobacillus sp. 47C-IIb]QNU31272.1 hypothetical protein IC804_18260 [Geobacillus sp. 47C-IIb]QNU31289.1 hypothetical protein IC804_00085 [Geobacillus sp. 47C-IIb]